MAIDKVSTPHGGPDDDRVNEERTDQAQAPEDSPGRKAILLRLDPEVHRALARWASDDNRSVNAQIEILLRDALHRAGRAPRHVRPLRGPGRPRTTDAEDASST